MLQITIYDSHRFFKPYTIKQLPDETERQFNRRTYAEYLKMCHKWDGYNGTGNTVYMSNPIENGAAYSKQ